MKALYIATVKVKAVNIVNKKKRDIRTVTRELCPVVCDENGVIDQSDINRQLRRFVKSSIDHSKFNNFSYTYEISNLKFSSKLYNSN